MPNTPQCQAEREAGANVNEAANQPFTNWPQNIHYTTPMYFIPKTRAELANAILQAEGAGHHVRAIGSAWSFSDVACSADSSPAVPTLIPSRPGALIDTSQLLIFA